MVNLYREFVGCNRKADVSVVAGENSITSIITN